MKISVYLPDEIGRKAKMWKINFSLTLRKAVIKELENRNKKPNMKQIKFSIIGTSPLIQHKFRGCTRLCKF